MPDVFELRFVYEPDRLDRMRERHELGVCSRLGLGHLGGERLRPLRQCLVRRATLSTAAPFSWF